MVVVVVGVGAAPARLEWQARLGAVQCLNLALLVDAQDHGVLGWSQIHAHHVRQLLQEARITGKLEGLGQVRLQAVVLPNPVNRVLADSLCSRKGARAPVGATRRLGLQGGVDPLTDPGGIVTRLAPPPRRDLPDTAYALLADSPSPQRHRLAANRQHRCNCLVGLPFRHAADDAGPQYDLLRRGSGTNPLLEATKLSFCKGDRNASA